MWFNGWCMKRGGVRSIYLSNCDGVNLKHKTSFYNYARHALLAFVMGWFYLLQVAIFLKVICSTEKLFIYFFTSFTPNIFFEN